MARFRGRGRRSGGGFGTYATINVFVQNEEQAKEALNRISNRLREDAQKGLIRASKKVGDVLMSNYEAEGRKHKGWDPLKPSTIRSRESLGFGAGPILERSGAMKEVLIEQIQKRPSANMNYSRTDSYRGTTVSIESEVKTDGDKTSITFTGKGWKTVHQDGSVDSPKRPFWYADKSTAFAAAEGIRDWITDDVLKGI